MSLMTMEFYEVIFFLQKKFLSQCIICVCRTVRGFITSNVSVWNVAEYHIAPHHAELFDIASHHSTPTLSLPVVQCKKC